MRLGRGVRSTGLSLCLAVLCALTVSCATTDKRAEEQNRLRRAQSHLDIGIGYLENGRSALALREFMNAAELDPRNARIQHALGEAYLMRGKPEESEIHLKRALELYPDLHDARLSLTGLYLIQERYEDAIVHCDLLLDDPTFPAPYSALANRGFAELKLGRRDQARRSLELARDYSPKYWPALLSLAILEEREGHRADAVALLHDVLDLAPGPRVESEVNYRLAEIYVALGKRREAMGHLTTSVARAPDSPWAKKSKEYLKILH